MDRVRRIPKAILDHAVMTFEPLAVRLVEQDLFEQSKQSARPARLHV
jgi:hypothetical protein